MKYFAFFSCLNQKKCRILHAKSYFLSFNFIENTNIFNIDLIWKSFC